MPKRILAVWPALVLMIFTLVFFRQLAFTELILGRGDTFAYFYPYWAARNSALLQGQLPLWTSDLFMGVPLLANSQLGTFYPLNWLVAWLSPPDGIRVSILLHIYAALLGAYLLARSVLGKPNHWRDELPTLGTALVFGLGGYVSAHVEQINQLQGLAWLPWLFLLYRHALWQPVRMVPLLAGALALQFFTGHTQTVFISGIGLGLYGLLDAVLKREQPLLKALLRSIGVLLVAGTLALILVIPQLVPTMELTEMSNRRGGLNQNEATAFSLNPLVAARGLLPSYDSAIFSEFIAYTGVVGLGLTLLGLLVRQSRLPRERWLWGMLAFVGLLLAFGEANPLYWTLATLPGFNLFRVPARWLALFALGIAVLTGLGLRLLLDVAVKLSRWIYAVVIGVLAGLVGLSFAAQYAAQMIEGSATPSAITLAGWGLGAAIFLLGFILWRRGQIRIAAPLLTGALVVELLLAAGVLPYNLLVPPEVYDAGRFTAHQLRAYGREQTPPGRMLSISQLLFDPGDKATLEARYRQRGLDDRAVRLALVDTKQQEIIAPNLPLVWGVPSIDGFDGGLLPTAHYTAFTSLLLPNGSLRTIDGRLRENLALASCRGACLPDQRWLDLTNTRYLITDKVFDLWHDGVAYDTQFQRNVTSQQPLVIADLPDFVTTAVDVLYIASAENEPPRLTLTTAAGDDQSLVVRSDRVAVESAQRARFVLESAVSPQDLQIEADTPLTVLAVTLVDTRTGDFAQVTLGDWERVLSSDIKVYENQTVLPRAFFVTQASWFEDSELGTETSVQTLSVPEFDPTRRITINSDQPAASLPASESDFTASVEISAYAPTQVSVAVSTDAPGYLLLTDAFYPGWQASIDQQPVEILRADVMFRAVQIPAGEHTVMFEYHPGWLDWIGWAGGFSWLGLLATIIATRRWTSE